MYVILKHKNEIGFQTKDELSRQINDPEISKQFTVLCSAEN